MLLFDQPGFCGPRVATPLPVAAGIAFNDFEQDAQSSKRRRCVQICTPLLIAGIALTAGSMAANSAAQSQVENARNDVLAAETQRQRGYNREIENLNTQSQDRYVGFDAQQYQRADDLASRFATDITDPNNASMIPGSASNIVNRETDAQMNDAQGYVDQQSGALADMRAFGDLLGETSLYQARDASKVGQLGGFKMGSQGITPYELDDANKAGDGTKLFGDLLRLGGTVATGAGVAGIGPSFAELLGQGSKGFVPGLTGPSLGWQANTWYGV